MFSRRARWDAPLNELTVARRRREAAGAEILNLTAANPTRAGLRFPLDELSEIFSRAALASYDPEPRGLRSAREAVAAQLACHPDELLLTASTSEAYSYLFKLLTDPGDPVVTTTPSYPLLEHLAAMELVSLRPFALEFHGRWSIESASVRGAIDDSVRAVIVVNPNNPTGSFVTPDEADLVASLGVPVIADEVFLDFPVEGSGRTLAREDVLTFTLGGLSKSAGLPHLKLGWIRATGPGSVEALNALEAIADNYLSVSTPVQIALPEILVLAPQIRQEIATRLTANLAVLRAAFSAVGAARVLPVEGGWSAVVRVPRVLPDEALALALLDRGVLVQPGYFFDFESDGFLVVSLLTEESTFSVGVGRVSAFIAALS